MTRAPYVPGVSGTRPAPRAPLPIVDDDAPLAPAHVAAWHEGLALLDEGFAWEAHEVFETLWHASRRRGGRAALAQAMAKVGAALVKERQGSAIGRETHLAGALTLVDEAGRADVPLDHAALRAVVGALVEGRAPKVPFVALWRA